MEVVIERTIDGYRQTITDKIDGKKRIRRTNNINRIENLIAKLPSNPKFIEVNKTDIKIVYPYRHTLVLKQYQKNLETRIYSTILDNIDENTPIIKKLKKNNKKLATLALSSIIFASSLIGVGISLGNDEVTSLPISEPSSYVYVDDTFLPPKVEVIEPQLVSEDNFNLEVRIDQTRKLINQEISNNYNIPLASNINDYAINKIITFIESSDGQYFLQTAEDFGVDPYTFICLMMGESSLNHEDTIPGGKFYNGFGVGICQLESPHGQEITAYNYTTKQNETVYETMENALDKKTNIKMGIMRYQNVLERYHGNERLALQSYNFGYGLVDLIIQIYADEKGITYDEVVDNFNDTGWLKYVKLASEDPVGFANNLDANKYSNYGATIEYLKNWQYGTYGNGNYLNNLYSYYLGIYSSNIVDGKILQTNLLTDETVRYTLENVDYKTMI